MKTTIAVLMGAASVVAGVAQAGNVNTTMNRQQQDLFERAYPGAELLLDCQGNFSGASGEEHVLGLRRTGEKPVRVGLVLDGGKWLFHDIEGELKADKLPPRIWPQEWETPPTGAAPKCKVDLRHDRDLSYQGKPLGGAPLFPLRHGQTAACFATSEQYNNWDCITYRNGKFSLWYQQIFAD